MSRVIIKQLLCKYHWLFLDICYFFLLPQFITTVLFSRIRFLEKFNSPQIFLLCFKSISETHSTDTYNQNNCIAGQIIGRGRVNSMKHNVSSNGRMIVFGLLKLWSIGKSWSHKLINPKAGVNNNHYTQILQLSPGNFSKGQVVNWRRSGRSTA